MTVIDICTVPALLLPDAARLKLLRRSSSPHILYVPVFIAPFHPHTLYSASNPTAARHGEESAREAVDHADATGMRAEADGSDALAAHAPADGDDGDAHTARRQADDHAPLPGDTISFAGKSTVLFIRYVIQTSVKASSTSSPHTAGTPIQKRHYTSHWPAQKKGGVKKGKSIKESYQLARQRTPAVGALDGRDNMVDTSPTSTSGYSAEVKTLCGSELEHRFPPECRAPVLAGRKCPSCGGEGKMKWQLCYKMGMEGAIAIFVSDSYNTVLDTQPAVSSAPTRSSPTIPW